jgi:hypothetical protein
VFSEDKQTDELDVPRKVTLSEISRQSLKGPFVGRRGGAVFVRNFGSVDDKVTDG